MGYDSMSWGDPTGAGPGVASACSNTSSANESRCTCESNCSECDRPKEKTRAELEAEVASLKSQLKEKENPGMTYPSQSCRDCI